MCWGPKEDVGAWVFSGPEAGPTGHPGLLVRVALSPADGRWRE